MRLKSKFDAGAFAVLAELHPPKGIDVRRMVAEVTAVGAQVDAFVINDMSDAVMRMSALCGAVLLQARGMETVMQIGVRNRNRLALQGDLLGAGACGIPNLLTITGQAPCFGDQHQAVEVHDLDHLDLLYAITGLQGGKDLAGRDLEGVPVFALTGSTVNPGLKGQALELEIEKMNRRYDAGARFFVTPPLFELDDIDAFRQRVDCRKYRIIPTVMLIKSLGVARYIERHLKHINMPPALIARLRSAADKTREGLIIAREMIAAVRAERFCGVQISTLGRENQLPVLLASEGAVLTSFPPRSSRPAAIS